MKELFDKISEECSKNVTKSYSTSFSLATKMLSSNIRQDIYNIYGFVRFADEIVDTFHSYNKKELFSRFVDDLNYSLIEGISLNPILNSFQKTVNKYNIDKSLIDAFLKSMEQDLEKKKYKSLKEYKDYIYGSADVVGLMCLKVFVGGNNDDFNRVNQAYSSGQHLPRLLSGSVPFLNMAAGSYTFTFGLARSSDSDIGIRRNYRANSDGLLDSECSSSMYIQEIAG